MSEFSGLEEKKFDAVVANALLFPVLLSPFFDDDDVVGCNGEKIHLLGCISIIIFRTVDKCFKFCNISYSCTVLTCSISSMGHVSEISAIVPVGGAGRIA